MTLATRGPSGIIRPNGEIVELNSDSLRDIRAGEKSDTYHDGRYIIDCSAGNTGSSPSLFFNLYDSFISGEKKVVRILVPRNPDYNRVSVSLKS